MITNYKYLTCLVLVSVIASCANKVNYFLIERPAENSQFLINNREYFWAESRQRTANSLEMVLQTQQLTDSIINKGLKVGVAIYADSSRFETLPVTLDDPSWLGDTIQISYTVLPGKLNVFAKTSLNLSWRSDVFIQY